MRVPTRPGVHLTYCSNIHPGEDWPATRRNVLEHFSAVRRRVAPGQPFGVGLRLSALALAQLCGSVGERERFADTLAREQLYVFTLNGFPYGPFHGESIKQRVYLPDWSDPDRLHYTLALAQVLAELLPLGVRGSISTVPGGFRPHTWMAEQRRAIAQNLLIAAASLWLIAEQHDKHITLALEPEPHCLLETTSEAIHLFEAELLDARAVAWMCRATGLAAASAEQVIRDHLGVCLDACHAAVEFEAPRDAVERLRAAGIRLAKLQVAAGIELVPTPAALDALAHFDDRVYLHQVVAEHDDGSLTRWLDLRDAIDAARRGWLRARRWRVHLHVPVFTRELGLFASTQDFLPPLLEAVLDASDCSQLELETYTWHVLPAHVRGGAIDDAIARELGWVLAQLAGDRG